MNKKKSNIKDYIIKLDNGKCDINVLFERFMILYVFILEQNKRNEELGDTDFATLSSRDVFDLVNSTFEKELSIQTIYKKLSNFQKQGLLKYEADTDFDSGRKIHSYYLARDGYDEVERLSDLFVIKKTQPKLKKNNPYGLAISDDGRYYDDATFSD